MKNKTILTMRFVTLIIIAHLLVTSSQSFAEPTAGVVAADVNQAQPFKVFEKSRTFYALPSAWVKKLKAIQVVAEKSKGQLSAQTNAAIKTFSNALPVSPRTRELQSQMRAKYKALEGVADDQVPKLWSEIFDLENKIDAEVTNQQISALLEPLDTPGTPNLSFGRTADESRSGTLSNPPVNTAVSKPSLQFIGNADFNKLQAGDVILIKSGSKWSWPWTRTYSHAGIYDGDRLVYEANYGDKLRHRSLDTYWKQEGCQIALGRIKGANLESMTKALTWANQQWGEDQTPYNLKFWDKHRIDKLYCSQFVWQLFMKAATGTDVDSNSVSYAVWAAGRYGDWVLPIIERAVAPDEVRDSPHIEFYAEGIYSSSLP